MAPLDKKCWHTALRLLTGRDHSCQELCEKLALRGFIQEQISPVIQECLRLNYLDDENFSHVLTQQLRRKGYGVLRIAQALKKKGLASDLIQACLELHCDHTKQLQDCLKVLEKKISIQGAHQSRTDTKARLFRFLNGRGYSFTVIQEAFRVSALDTF